MNAGKGVSMKEQQDKQQTYQEPFPYKTYDEILMEKNRRERFRHGMVVMSGIFLMFCAIIIGISMIWNRNPNPFSLLVQTSDSSATGDPTGHLDTAQVQQGGNDLNFTLPFIKAEEAEEPEPEKPVNGDLIYVSDVSEIVKKARASVVGVEAESYAGYVTSRTGSGIILSEDGYIITNSHVISGCDSIVVTLDNGEEYAAFVVGDDSYSDIAVLKIDAEDLTAAVLGDSDQVEVGQPAIAIGNPTGYLQGTTTFGIISGVNRNMVVNNVVMNLLQTDAAINSGNSGGPLLNQYGQVIGINSAKVSISGYEGLGFAIPINSARPIAEELVRNGSVTSRPMLGVTGVRLSSMASSFYGLPQGVYLTAVDPDSNAAEAGLQSGDVITHIDEKRVNSLSSAAMIRDTHTAGDVVSITFFRRGNTMTIPVKLVSRQAHDTDNNL